MIVGGVDGEVLLERRGDNEDDKSLASMRLADHLKEIRSCMLDKVIFTFVIMLFLYFIVLT